MGTLYLIYNQEISKIGIIRY